MKYVLRWTKLALAVAMLGLVLPRRSMAYLDPGTGSYMLQMLIALLVGGAFAVKVFWRRIIAFIKRQPPPAPDPQQEPPENEHQQDA